MSRVNLEDNQTRRQRHNSPTFGCVKQKLTADYTITDTGPTIHFFDPNGVNRTVHLPAFRANGGQFYFISNTGAANTLIVVDSLGGAVCTIAIASSAILFSSPSSWGNVLSSSASAAGIFGAPTAGHFATWNNATTLQDAGAPSATLLDTLTGFASNGYLKRTGAGAYSFIASGGAGLDDISGFAGTGFITRTGAATYAFLADPLSVAHGGTNAAAASGTALDNITGFASNGYLKRTGAGAYSFSATIPNGDLTNSAVTIGTTTISLGATSLTLAGVNSYNKVALTAPATGSTFTLIDGKTLTVNNTITFGAVDGKTVNFNNSMTLTAVDTTTFNMPGNPSTSNTNVGFLEIPQNSKSANYTTVLGDSGKQIFHPAADNNPRTFTIDSNANVTYPIGTTLTFINMINTVTIAITTDTLTQLVTGNTGSRTLAANGMATATKVASTQWVIGGSGLS